MAPTEGGTKARSRAAHPPLGTGFRQQTRAELQSGMTKYRIDASFDLIGGFWHFEEPDEKLTGTLSCKNGLGEFVSSPVYTKLDESAYREAFRNMTGDQILQPVGTILGFTTDKKCTLLDCYTLQDDGLTHFPHVRTGGRKAI